MNCIRRRDRGSGPRLARAGLESGVVCLSAGSWPAAFSFLCYTKHYKPTSLRWAESLLVRVISQSLVPLPKLNSLLLGSLTPPPPSLNTPVGHSSLKLAPMEAQTRWFGRNLARREAHSVKAHSALANQVNVRVEARQIQTVEFDDALFCRIG